MNILHVITKRQLRGAEIFASQLSEEFVREGHEVMIVALHPAAALTTELGVAHMDFDLDPSRRWWSYAAWKKFATIVRTWKPDIVQANASETMKFTVISKTLFRWKVPLVYRNASKVSDFITSLPSKWVNAALARSVDSIISVSENCRVDYVQTFGLSPGNTITIPIGTVHFDEGWLPSKSSAASQAPYWINVATLAPEKNHKGLLSIYKRYREQGGKAELKIVGGGPGRDSLEALSVSLGLDGKVHFLGYSHDVTRLMIHSEGLLLPSFIEGLPGVILEAMAVHIPVIATAVGGVPEVVHHKETGMLIAKGEEQPFVEAMLELERNPVIRKRIVDNAFAVCYQDYRIEAIAHRFLAEYERIIAARPPSQR